MTTGKQCVMVYRRPQEINRHGQVARSGVLIRGREVAFAGPCVIQISQMSRKQIVAKAV